MALGRAPSKTGGGTTSVLPLTLDTVNNRVGVNNPAPGCAFAVGPDVTASSLTLASQLTVGQTGEGANATLRLGQSTTVGVNMYYTSSATVSSRRLTIDSAAYAVPIYMAGKNMFLQHDPANGSKAVVIGTTTLDTDGTSRLRVSCTYDGITAAAPTKWDGVNVLASTLTIYAGANITNTTGVNVVNIEQSSITSTSALSVSFAASLRIAGAPTGIGAGPVSILNPLALWVDADLTRLDGGLYLPDGSNIQTDTTTGIKIGTLATQKIGFWAKTPVVQPSTTGETVGFTTGVGTAVKDDSTFTGNAGATAYRISDVVKHLKTVGLLAA